jgi:hypothetical protein
MKPDRRRLRGSWCCVGWIGILSVTELLYGRERFPIFRRENVIVRKIRLKKSHFMRESAKCMRGRGLGFFTRTLLGGMSEAIINPFQ